MAERLIMHIDADAFFASVEQGFNRQLRGRPVIVGGEAGQRGVVHTASYEARACGIRTGMPLIRAKKLCPRAVFIKGDFAHYRAVGDSLREIYLRYTPRVEFTSLDDAYLDIGDSVHLFGSPVYMAREIRREAEEKTGVSLSFGIGGSKMIARIASGLDKPRGINHITPEHEKAFLRELAVEHLPGVGRRVKEKLVDLHIFTVGQLAALPRLAVEQMLGKNGRTLWKLANGIDEREVERKVVPRQISRETSFPRDTGDEKAILGGLQYLTERIARRLREQSLSARTVGLKLGYADFSRAARAKSLERASSDGAEIFGMVRYLYGQMRLKRVHIRHIGVSVTQVRDKSVQETLFDGPRRAEALNSAVDELRERFGFMAVMPAETLQLKSRYRNDAHGYILHNPALTR